MKKGEVWIADIPELGGHEQKGVRPIVIVADTQTTVAIVIPCTSNLRALQLPATLLIEPSPTNGLKTSSIALILQLRAIDKKRLKKKIGIIERFTIKEINKGLKQLLDL